MTQPTALARISINTICMYAAWAVRKLCTFALAIVVARVAGVAEFGVYCLALVWMEAAIRLAVWGTDILVVRETSAQRPDAACRAGNALGWRLAASAAIYPLMTLAARMLNPESPLAGVVAVMGGGMIAQSAANLYLSRVQGRERVDLHAGIQGAANLLGLALGVAALHAGYGLTGLAAAYTLRGLFSLLLATLAAWKLGVAVAPRMQPACIGRLLATAAPIGINRLVTVLYLGSGMTLLQLVQGEQALGLFAAAMKIFEACTAFGTLTMVAAFPTIARLQAASRDGLRRTSAAIVRLFGWVGIPMSVLVATQARNLLALFRPEFTAGAPALILLMLAVPFSLNSELAERLAYAHEDQRKVLGIRLTGVVLNFGILLATVGPLGFLAPAVAILAAETAMLALFLPLWRRYIPRSRTPWLPGHPLAWRLLPPERERSPLARRVLPALAARYLFLEQWGAETLRFLARYLVAVLCRATGLCRLARRRGLRRRIVILSYHRVADGDDPLELNISPRRFRAQMRYLARTMQPVDLDRVAAALAGRAAMPDAGVTVTFDDAYRGDPRALREAVAAARIPTTIYAAPALLDDARQAWWEQLAALLRHAADAGFRLAAADGGRDIDLRNARARRLCGRALAEALRPLPPAQRRSHLSRMAETLHANPNAVLPPRLFFAWGELRELAAEPMITIGSHSWSHHPLQAHEEVRFRQELRQSKSLLRDQLRTDIRHFAYPSGSNMQKTPTRQERLAAEGFLTAATNRPGLTSQSSDPFELHRIGIGNEPFPLFVAKVSGLFEWLKTPWRSRSSDGHPSSAPDA